jgi:hypothetical protein
MAVCWEQEQPDGKPVTSSTSGAVSEVALNPEVMQIPPAPEESGYQNVAALVGVTLYSNPGITLVCYQSVSGI